MKTQEIQDRILVAIVDKKLPPGTKINERELAEIFGVSRTIVRQALNRLQQEGLVVISPKRATTVAKPTIEEAHQLFDAIAIIEGAVIERLARIGKKSAIDRLKKHVAAEHKASRAGDRVAANRLARDFHELFVGLVDNPLIIKAHSQLLKQQALITALFRTDFDYDELQGDHMKVVECLAAGQIDAAKETLNAHYKLVIRGYQFRDGTPDNVSLSEIFSDV